jgi:hypothetical protein
VATVRCPRSLLLSPGSVRNLFLTFGLAIALLVTQGVWPALSADDAAKPPRAVVPDAVIDLGARPAGETVRATFTVRNEGGEPLTVQAGTVVPATPPVKIEVKGAPVPPGKAATIVASFAPRVGPISYRIPLTTNDPESPDLSVRVSLKGVAALIAKPASLRFSAIEGDPPTTVVIDVASPEGSKYKVLRVDPPSGVEATFAEAKADQRRAGVAGSQWRVTVKLSSAGAKSPTEKIVIVTDHPQQKELTVPLYGTVTTLITSLPAAAVLKPDAAGHIEPIVIHVMAVRDVKIEQVTTNVPGLGVEIKPDKPAQSFKLRVTSKEPLAAGSLDGTIDLKLAGEPPFTFKIPVRRDMPPPPGSDVPGGL